MLATLRVRACLAKIASGIFVALSVAACNAIPELTYGSEPADSSDTARDAQADHPGTADGSAGGSDALTGDGDLDAIVPPADTSFPSTDDADSQDAQIREASPPDAAVEETSAPDTGPLTCPASPPPGASICCGATPCHGASASCTSECTNCKNNCAGKACCLDQNGNFHGCAGSADLCP